MLAKGWSNLKSNLEETAKSAVKKMTCAANEMTKSCEKRRKRHGAMVRACCIAGALAAAGLGCFVGIHRHVIMAMLHDEKMPKAPDWHFWCK